MTTIIHQSKPKARHDYSCDACLWLTECDIRQLKLTFPEWRSVAKAKANGFKIKKGDVYLYQFNSDSGRNTWTFRAIPEIHDICIKYGYYED